MIAADRTVGLWPMIFSLLVTPVAVVSHNPPSTYVVPSSPMLKTALRLPSPGPIPQEPVPSIPFRQLDRYAVEQSAEPEPQPHPRPNPTALV